MLHCSPVSILENHRWLRWWNPLFLPLWSRVRCSRAYFREGGLRGMYLRPVIDGAAQVPCVLVQKITSWFQKHQPPSTFAVLHFRICSHLTSATRWRIWGAYHFTLSKCTNDTFQQWPKTCVRPRIRFTSLKLKYLSTFLGAIINYLKIEVA